MFRLSQDYPTTDPSDARPWQAFDPKTQPAAYIKSLLTYFYEGNIQPDPERSFDPALNISRHWYNAPWQDVGVNGREPIHGMTRERVSRPGELAPTQTHSWNNYAVGFYNGHGGYTIGRMWANRGQPDAALAGSMPEGTVAAKLLFTTANEQEVPYLKGAPKWSAYVYADPNDPNPKSTSARAMMKLRLLQIDVAVKDAKAGSPTGWVFGTFVYGGGPGGALGTGWNAVAPVGVMWGNDPGNFSGKALSETWLNPAVLMPHVGFQGRLNGPVDNASSSCLSCHSTAETPAGDMIGSDPNRWFRNIPAGTAFDAGRQSLDYSLQLAVGLSNFQRQQTLIHAPPALRQRLFQQIMRQSQTPPRDGGRNH
ncbi:MAG TPA: hypothetical protein VGU01_14765 [Sphingomicrobium sp.]|nr:hypothetical protein [Sphingomicrobium sp.]